MTPTTLYAIREVVAAAILAITPDHPEHQDARWNRVRSINDVQGNSLRNFLVRLLPSTETSESFYGDGESHEADLQVWACYGGLEDDADGPMIDEDARQLYHRLVLTIDPANPGIEAYTPIGWTYEDDAPGHVYGYHLFRVRFLAADTVNQ